MTTDMALRPNTILPGKKKSMDFTDFAYPMDQKLMLNALRDLDVKDGYETANLWQLTKAALATIRTLQDDMSDLQDELTKSHNRIRTLEQVATTDELTGLTNRRGFLDLFEKELDRTNREQVKGGLLIMIDMDNFKSINDTYGHLAGDEALRLTAQTMQAHIRKMDLAARMGGDEFVLLLSNADPIGAVDRAQKLVRKLNALTMKWDGERVPVRASLGLQSYGKGDTVETVFAKADKLMYQAKKERKKANA